MSLFDRKTRKNIVLVGCGSFGTGFSDFIDAKSDNVTVIDKSVQSFSKLRSSSNFSFIEGEPTDIEILENAGINSADIVIAVTDDDNANIMIARIAKDRYHIEKVIAKINDASKESIYSQMGIMVVSPLLLVWKEIQILISDNEV